MVKPVTEFSGIFFTDRDRDFKKKIIPSNAKLPLGKIGYPLKESGALERQGILCRCKLQ